MRNQRLNAPQVCSHQLESGGSGLGSGAYPYREVVRGTLRSVRTAGWEVTVKARGVAVAMPQEHSWAPRPSIDLTVNVGTHAVVPFPDRVQRLGGKARRRPMPPCGGGGSVVVRVRESRSHGEGVQFVRGYQVWSGGRW